MILSILLTNIIILEIFVISSVWNIRKANFWKLWLQIEFIIYLKFSWLRIYQYIHKNGENLNKTKI